MTRPAAIPEPVPGPADPARLDALRAELARRNLTGFVVPRSDQHQGEYVAPHAQRLAWLTGFTGSAGVAVVLKERAAIFVDGRYTLQVRQEVDTARFEPVSMIDTPLARWLGEVLAKGDRLGVDPWLHTPEQVDALKAACERTGAELVTQDSNPLDAVWPDQPPLPASSIVEHDARFAGRGSVEKRVDVAETLKAERLDAALLSDPASVAWLLNIRGHDVAYTPLPLAFALVHADASVDLFVDRPRLPDALVAEWAGTVRVRPPAELGAALDGLKGKKVRLDQSTAPFAALDRLTKAGAKPDRGTDPCALPKACKNEVELDGARAAHRRDGAAIARFLAWLAAEAPKGTLTELDASDRLEAIRAEGEHFRGLSFPTISGAGPHGAIVHYRSTPRTNRAIGAGEVYLLDSGAQYLDGTTDITRTLAIGTVPDEARTRFTLVLKGHIAVATARFPVGTTGAQLDVLARHALWASGLDYDHGTGHGVGSFLSVHEGPQRISKMGQNAVALKPGMVLSNEPGYYKEGAYGIRIENLLAVTEPQEVEGGERPMMDFETLTLVPMDLAMIEPAQLTAPERAWLNAYHARVRTEISPLVDEATRAWLAAATAAI
jgi:Xaa-Pro aminopeptidase